MTDHRAWRAVAALAITVAGLSPGATAAVDEPQLPIFLAFGGNTNQGFGDPNPDMVVLSSLDGQTWHRWDTDGSLEGAATDGTMWIVVGNGRMYSTTDGVTWQDLQPDHSTDLNDIAHGGPGGWIAAGYGLVKVSPDGQTWTTVPLEQNDLALTRIATDGTQWIASGIRESTHTNLVIRSFDGVTWEPVLAPSYWWATLELHYACGQWLMRDGPWLSASTDGEHWTTQYQIAHGLGYYHGWRSVYPHHAYSNDFDGFWSRSADGIQWTNSVQEHLVFSLAHDGPAWVAVGWDGKMIYSPDGETWNQLPTITDAELVRVVSAASNLEPSSSCPAEAGPPPDSTPPPTPDPTPPPPAPVQPPPSSSETTDRPPNSATRSGDSDQDGIHDTADNCPSVINVHQADEDADSIGDACDVEPGVAHVPSPTHLQVGASLGPDSDHDGAPDDADVCPSIPDPYQDDADRDGLGDACDVDLDGDGVIQYGAEGLFLDNCPTMVNANQRDRDADGVGDACEPVEKGCPTCPLFEASDRPASVAAPTVLPWAIGAGVIATVILGAVVGVVLSARRRLK